MTTQKPSRKRSICSVLVALFGSALIAAGCMPVPGSQGIASISGLAKTTPNSGSTEPTSTTAAYNPTQIPTLDPVLARATATIEAAKSGVTTKIERAKTFEEKAAVQQATIWRQKPSNVDVCWDTPGFAAEKAWVQDAVARTWVLESALKFVGWQSCTQTSKGIRITVSDEGPYTQGLGEQLDGVQRGMVLNFTFQQWSSSCSTPDSQRKFCIEAIAAHEFGHAIGFTHEQNRDDAPGWCRDQAQGGNPDLKVTAYDIDSIMNYCNPLWNNNGLLSHLDVHAVRVLYGVPASAYWRFDEGSGSSAHDESWNNNSGVISGAAYTSSVPAMGNTSSNKYALLFSKEGDYISIAAGDKTNLHVFKSGITVEAFVRPSKLPIPLDRANQRIKYIVWADDDAYSILLRSDASGNTTLNASINCGINAPGRSDATVGAPFDPSLIANGFAHVAFTYGDGELSLYINRQRVGQVSGIACGNAVGPVSSRGLVHIGSDETAICCNHDRDFRGLLDEVRISSRPLNADEFLGPNP